MKVALVIGGTGTLGRVFVPLLHNTTDYDRIRVLSRGEHPQIEMARELEGRPIDFLLGDVRDYERVSDAVRGCHTVFNFAATKSVDKVEYDPYEAVQTNVTGAYNVVRACKKHKVEKALFTSTDKAVAPLNTYGATKLLAEKLWIHGNIGNWPTKFAAVRYGNVFGSRGSVIEKWRQGPPYKITDPTMTRFFMTVKQAAHFILDAWRTMRGGEIYIPKMKSVSMGDLLDFVAPKAGHFDVETIGIRPGEKLHECLYTEDEQRLITQVGETFIRWPSHQLFPISRRGEEIGNGSYTSENAERFTQQELAEL